MELAEPSIETAFARCVERGAKTVVVFPYFLLPGRHWNDDIPRLAAAAAENHPGIRYLVTAPFGLHPLMAEIMQQRIAHCLRIHAGRSRCLRRFVLAPTDASCARLPVELRGTRQTIRIECRIGVADVHGCIRRAALLGIRRKDRMKRFLPATALLVLHCGRIWVEARLALASRSCQVRASGSRIVAMTLKIRSGAIAITSPRAVTNRTRISDHRAACRTTACGMKAASAARPTSCGACDAAGGIEGSTGAL
jgi:sirohydrochlorin ferrochelatase